MGVQVIEYIILGFLVLLIVAFNVWARCLDSSIRHVRVDMSITGQMIEYDQNTEFMPQKIDEFNGRAIYEVRRR